MIRFGFIASIGFLVAGCGSSATPAVNLMFSGAMMAVPDPGTGYKADIGSATHDQDMNLVLDSKAGGAEFTITTNPPTMPGEIDIGTFHIDLQYTLSPSGPTWSSSIPPSGGPGSVVFQTVQSPFTVTINHVQMLGSNATGAHGSFFIDGTAQFQ